MVDWNQGKRGLVDAEFYMLADNRPANELLAGSYLPDTRPEWDPAYGTDLVPNQYDGDPERSAALSMARLREFQELYGREWRRPALPSLFEDERVTFDPDLLIGVAYFEGRVPRPLNHWDRITDYAQEPYVARTGELRPSNGTLDVVSPSWREAIEGLEPGVHQFFPYELRFSDGVVRDHAVFRNRQVLDFIDLERSELGRGVYKLSRPENAGRLALQSDPWGLAARGDVLRGRHWVRPAGRYDPFVSRALATKLHPTLPDGVQLREVLLV